MHKNLLVSLCLVYIVMIFDTFVFTNRKQTPVSIKLLVLFCLLLKGASSGSANFSMKYKSIYRLRLLTNFRNTFCFDIGVSYPLS